jgi:type II secretory ATPase GspE/PulE/Tfp pilus assembly ATPase PilB-like protein
MNRLDQDVYSVLESRNMLSREELSSCLNKSKGMNISLCEYIIANHCIEEKLLLQIISELSSIPYIDLREIKIEKSVIDIVPAKIAWHYNFLPIKLEAGKLAVAVNTPLSIGAQDELKLILGHRIDMVLARKEQIKDMLKASYGLAADIVKQMSENSAKPYSVTPARESDNVEDIEKLAGDASVVNLVNQIIFEAYKKRATDIHIEPFQKRLRLRYRIDGVLRDQQVPREVHSFIMPILSRIKIMSNLNIVERRVPQDGRATVRTQNEMLDLRVSFMPTSHGESVVIRMLPAKAFFNIEQLGLLKDDVDILRRLIGKSSGIIFLTGPTGSGKTTTLYSCLKEINSSEKKIVTIEDPVEYEMENIIQVSVNTATGLTFARGLRSMLRHDPDIVMVGEVRDKETAEIAISVALTGHLVLSTLHTNDAATGALRLIDIGIEPYLVSSSIEAFIAQRLIRLVCQKCKYKVNDIPDELKESIIRALGHDSTNDINLQRGKGCESCNFTGYYGRTAIYEILAVDEDIKALIARGASSSDINNKAVEKGMRTMIQHGWRKVAEGLTTPEEVLNACQDSAGSPVSVKEQLDNKRFFTRMPTRIYIKCSIVQPLDIEILKINYDKYLDATNAWPSNSSAILEPPYSKVSTNGTEISLFTTTSNVSAGGALIESEYLIPEGTVLDLKMHLPNGEHISCHGKVLRSSKEGLPFYFYIAVCFLDISGEQRKAINSFIANEVARQNVLAEGKREQY